MSAEALAGCFVNATRREAAGAVPPFPLAEYHWEAMEFLGWRDQRDRTRAYLVVEVDGVLRGAVLRATHTPGVHGVCALCRDVTELAGVRMFSARRAGDAGRSGNSVATLIHEDFHCNEYARRLPTPMVGALDPELFRPQRVEALQQRCIGFMRRIIG
ncbi:hypothetical protein HMPREF2128_08270 [Pseudoglutamicibacter albus DNF00011]|uniref:Elongation factor G-binding protein C-terminal treble-clef zinc-finger domain-containing protein n=1 Tax=Pseudoglutamicibacter albus DNF00011 TaxID=1401063 RepID=A0A095YBW6_9MICC|nr:hypothetical protein HMPREF2128_08270 [Pseudoglutamicibacter albus DNF00011]